MRQKRRGGVSQKRRRGGETEEEGRGLRRRDLGS